MADVKDILGVARGGAPPEPRKPEKKERVKRPEGMSREAFALLGGGANPAIPRHMLDGFKKKEAKPKPSTRGVVTFQFKPFVNQARKDGLQLRHWTKGFKDATGRIRDAHEGDYQFAKYNKKVLVYRYDEEEWSALFAQHSGDWSRGETDYLLQLAGLLDLRWVVMADRYHYEGGPPRTMEDLKERYYSMARRLLVHREGNHNAEAALANHPLLRQPYNAAAERARKAALVALAERDPAAEEADNQILEAARAIEERRKAEAAAQQQALAAQQRKAAAAQSAAAAAAAAAARAMPAAEVSVNPSDYLYPMEFPNLPPAPMGAAQPSLLGPSLEQLRPPPGVVCRSLHMAAQVEAQVALLGPGRVKPEMLDKALTDLRLVGRPRYFSRATTGAYLALHAELLHMLEKKRLRDSKRKKGDDGATRSDKRQRVAKRYD